LFSSSNGLFLFSSYEQTSIGEDEVINPKPKEIEPENPHS